MELLTLAARDLTAYLSGPLLLLWLIVGWSAPFLLLSAVLSLRRIAKALERIASSDRPARPAPPGSVIGV